MTFQKSLFSPENSASNAPFWRLYDFIFYHITMPLSRGNTPFWKFLYFIFCHITMPLSGVPQHPQLSRSSFFQITTQPMPLSGVYFILFFITSPCHFPEAGLSGNSHFSGRGAAYASFWKFPCFIFITSPCHFRVCHNTCDFPEGPFFWKTATFWSWDFLEIPIFLESGAANAPFWKFLYCIFLSNHHATF